MDIVYKISINYTSYTKLKCCFFVCFFVLILNIKSCFLTPNVNFEYIKLTLYDQLEFNWTLLLLKSYVFNFTLNFKDTL